MKTLSKQFFLVLALIGAVLVFVPKVYAIYTLPGLSESTVLKFCSAKRNNEIKEFICDLYLKLNFISIRGFDNEQRINELENSLGRRETEIKTLEREIELLKSRVTALEQRLIVPGYSVVPNNPQINPNPQPVTSPQPQIYPTPLPINSH